MQALAGREEFERWLDSNGIRLDASQWSLLETFLQKVVEYNKKVNLTSDSGESLLLRHVADALAALPVLKQNLPVREPSHSRGMQVAPSLPKDTSAIASSSYEKRGSRVGAEILDLGAGAGFIGITLKIVWPEIAMTLLESSSRKFQFLNWVCAELRLPGLRVALGRAPEGLHGRTFDAVLVRAVAPLEESARLALPVIRPGGVCLCYQTQALELAEDRMERILGEFKTDTLEMIPYRRPKETSDRHLIILRRGL